MLANYVVLGGIASLSGVLRAVVSYVIGRLSDKVGKKVFINAGSLLNSLSWFFRYSLGSALGVTFVSIYSGITSMIFEGPFTAKVYDRVNYHKNRLEYLAFRQMALGLGQLVALAVVYYTLSYKLGFILAGVGNLMLLFF